MTDDETKKLLSQAPVGRLGTSKNNQPYVVPICFIYHQNKIYFHCSHKGKKIDNIKTNPNVCLQVDEHRMVPASTPCKFTVHYQSTLVYGKVRFLTDPKEKLKILKLLMNKYDHNKLAEPLEEAMVHGVEIGEIAIQEITGKKNE
jgi:nitroimidazol reductase NimA-like FMN-containing flavoprotein (pyridoxamine 5'-phosphate oxidase superfamily)